MLKMWVVGVVWLVGIHSSSALLLLGRATAGRAGAFVQGVRGPSSSESDLTNPVVVTSIDHKTDAKENGKWFNFDTIGGWASKPDVKQCREGKEIWSGRIEWWQNTGGSTGNAHGRRSSGAAPGQWLVGDVVTTGVCQTLLAFDSETPDQCRGPEVSEGIAVVVPGLGEPERAAILLKNIAWLRRQNVPFDCMIYVYKSEADFPLNAKEFAPCQLVRTQGFWTDHLTAFPVGKTQRPRVMVLLDSVQVPKTANLTRMLNIMSRNQLDMVGLSESPDSDPDHLKLEQSHLVMLQNRSKGVGRITTYVDIEVNIFARESFGCFQGLQDLGGNKMGWGPDQIFSDACKARLGVIHEIGYEKWGTGSYDQTLAWQQFKDYMHWWEKRLGPKTPEMELGSLAEPDGVC